MYKIGIRIDGKWQYYLVEGDATVEKTVSLTIRAPGFDKISVARIEHVQLKDERND